MTLQEWYDLREIVLSASEGASSPLGEQYNSHPIAVAAAAYVKNRKQESIINDAAKSLAKLKPGIDSAVAEQQYWLVLGKS